MAGLHSSPAYTDFAGSKPQVTKRLKSRLLADWQSKVFGQSSSKPLQSVPRSIARQLSWIFFLEDQLAWEGIKKSFC